MTTFVLFSFTTSLYRFFLVFRLHVIFRSFIFVHMNQFFRYNHSRFNNHYSFINSGARRARGAQRSQYLWILVVVIITHQAKKIYDLITDQLHCGLKSSHQSQYTIHNHRFLSLGNSGVKWWSAAPRMKYKRERQRTPENRMKSSRKTCASGK